MARIKTGPIVADIAGSVGDNIFSRNASGPYVKSRVSPVIPASTYVTAAKDAMIDAAAAWSALSDDEYLAWAQFSENYPRASFHDGYRPIDPKSLFISCYINQVFAGVTPGPLPIPPGNPGMKKYIFDCTTSSGVKGAVIGGSVDSDYRLIFYCSKQQPLSVRSINTVPLYKIYDRNYYPGAYHVFNSFYLSRLGGTTPAYDERVFSKVRVIHAASGIEVGSLVSNSIGQGSSAPYTVGNTDIRSLAYNIPGPCSTKITTAAAGSIAGLTAYVHTPGGFVNVGLYSDNAGAADVLLASSGSVAPSVTGGWETFNFSSAYTVSAFTVYHLAIVGNGTPEFGYSSDAILRRIIGPNGFSLPNPATLNNASTIGISLFATVTP